MEKFLVPSINKPSRSVPIRMRLWDRPAVEVDGRLSREYRHKACQLFAHSCTEVGGLKHGGIGDYCRTNMANDITVGGEPMFTDRRGVMGLEFDSKGVYLACVTKSGCLTVHDFDALYFSMNHPPSSSLKNETSQILHLYEPRALYGVRWNPENQNEIACSASCLSGRVICLYDISYISSQPFEMLKRQISRPEEFTDMTFTSDGRRLIASDIGGNISIWDRNASNYPSIELTANPRTSSKSYMAGLRSIQLDVENRDLAHVGPYHKSIKGDKQERSTTPFRGY
ncbi:hypothetical protein ZOSMA_90G00210 [Zostera marina]|uniref:Transducin/WD40 repeat-like superfamily protein n=1 Tax=Zostera marina TaxID=29655 RepID=A0A0K9NJA2_ZOSMR|nr:hypothetical protein ZOSMA_90G00210 [Zostera marina]